MEKFYCRDLLLASYFISKGNPSPELQERNRRAVFLFDKTDRLMQDFEVFKEDEFMKSLANNYFGLKKMIYQLRDAKSKPE